MNTSNPSKHLQFTSFCATMRAYLTDAKGGYDDRYGRIPDARGGGTKAETSSKYHHAVAAYRPDTRVQGSWLMAHQSDRTGCLDGAAQEQTNRKGLEVSRFGLPVIAEQRICSFSGR